MQPVGEPSGQTARRHFLGELGRGLARGLALRQCAAEPLRDFWSCVQNRREVVFCQLIDRGGDQRGDPRRGGSSRQHSDFSEVVAGPDPQHFNLAFAFLARERQYAGANDEQRVQGRSRFDQYLALVVGLELQLSRNRLALFGRQAREDSDQLEEPFGTRLQFLRGLIFTSRAGLVLSRGQVDAGYGEVAENQIEQLVLRFY